MLREKGATFSKIMFDYVEVSFIYKNDFLTFV